MNSVFLEKRNKILGKDFYTNNSGKCFVLDYKGCNSILVAFYDPFCIVKCAYGQLKDGRVSNPMIPNVFNKGYLGVGSYNSVTHERLYYIWRSMLDNFTPERLLGVETDKGFITNVVEIGFYDIMKPSYYVYTTESLSKEDLYDVHSTKYYISDDSNETVSFEEYLKLFYNVGGDL